MKVITAVEQYQRQPGDIVCFLAGGISNCAEWQKETISFLERFKVMDHLVIFNPRRENFPIGDPNASKEQIKWEFEWLEKCDIFSMYFCAGPSDQPICMYELGRNIVRMQQKFPDTWEDRMVITVEGGYKRIQDVLIQTSLADVPASVVNIGFSTGMDDVGPHEHATRIVEAYDIINKSTKEVEK